MGNAIEVEETPEIVLSYEDSVMEEDAVSTPVQKTVQKRADVLRRQKAKSSKQWWNWLDIVETTDNGKDCVKLRCKYCQELLTESNPSQTAQKHFGPRGCEAYNMAQNAKSSKTVLNFVVQEESLATCASTKASTTTAGTVQPSLTNSSQEYLKGSDLTSQ